MTKRRDEINPWALFRAIELVMPAIDRARDAMIWACKQDELQKELLKPHVVRLTAVMEHLREAVEKEGGHY